MTNPDYSDPSVERKWFLGNGGFLVLRVSALDRDRPEIRFEFCEKDGNLVHLVTRPMLQ